MRFWLLEASGQGRCDLSNSDSPLGGVCGVIPLKNLCQGPTVSKPFSDGRFCLFPVSEFASSSFAARVLALLEISFCRSLASMRWFDVSDTTISLCPLPSSWVLAQLTPCPGLIVDTLHNICNNLMAKCAIFWRWIEFPQLIAFIAQSLST